MKKVTTFVLILAVCIIFSSCSMSSPKKVFNDIGNVFKSDEEMIRNRIDEFLDAYNTGDFEAILDCMDKRTRNQYKSAINMIENVGGSALKSLTGLGLSISLKDLFGFSVGTVGSDDDLLIIDIESIDVGEDDIAYVKSNIGFNSKMNAVNGSEEATIKLVKEGVDWYIRDIN